MNEAPVAAHGGLRRQRENLRHPPVVVDHYLDVLNRQGLVQTAYFLRRHAAEL